MTLWGSGGVHSVSTRAVAKRRGNDNESASNLGSFGIGSSLDSCGDFAKPCMKLATRPGLGASAENRELTVLTRCSGDEQFWLVQSDVDRALWIDTLSADGRGRFCSPMLMIFWLQPPW